MIRTPAAVSPDKVGCDGVENDTDAAADVGTKPSAWVVMEHQGMWSMTSCPRRCSSSSAGSKCGARGRVEGGWVDRVAALEGLWAEIAMVETKRATHGSKLTND